MAPTWCTVALLQPDNVRACHLLFGGCVDPRECEKEGGARADGWGRRVHIGIQWIASVLLSRLLWVSVHPVMRPHFSTQTQD